MSKHAAWLHKQLADWASDGLIDEPTRQTLAARYPETGQQLRGYSLLTSLGGRHFWPGYYPVFRLQLGRHAQIRQAGDSGRRSFCRARCRFSISRETVRTL